MTAVVLRRLAAARPNGVRRRRREAQLDRGERRTYDRRYQATLAVPLGCICTIFSTKISSKASMRCWSPTPRDRWIRRPWKRRPRWYVIGAYRAGEMERIGIKIPISGLSWDDLFEPWDVWREFAQ